MASSRRFHRVALAPAALGIRRFPAILHGHFPRRSGTVGVDHQRRVSGNLSRANRSQRLPTESQSSTVTTLTPILSAGGSFARRDPRGTAFRADRRFSVDNRPRRPRRYTRSRFPATTGVPAMADSSADRDPLDVLAEEFVARYRAGERPPLTEYADRHPDLADEIRDLFPALVEMEQLKPATGRPHRRLRPGGRAVRPGAGRRVPHPPPGRPRRHGRRLRGGAGVARPARRAEAAARRRPWPTRGGWSGSAARRRRRRGCTTRTSSRCSASARPTAGTTTPCSSSPASRWLGFTRHWEMRQVIPTNYPAIHFVEAQ